MHFMVHLGFHLLVFYHAKRGCIIKRKIKCFCAACGFGFLMVKNTVTFFCEFLLGTEI